MRLSLGVVLLAIISLSACSYKVPQDLPIADPALSQEIKANQTVAETISTQPSLSVYYSLLKSAQLIETLQGSGPYTVFAPVDNSFLIWPLGALDSLKSAQKKADASQFVTSYIVSGRLTLEDMKEGLVLKTLQGRKVTVVYKKSAWYLQDEKGSLSLIVDGGMSTANGSVFIIDTLLYTK